MFEYTIDATAEEPIMLILKQVGNTCDEHGNITERGIQGSDFCRELLQLDAMGKRRIQIWINSVGGSVIDGYSILGGMLRAKTRVDTYNIGVAASTAGWLYEAGQNRDMSDYATWMGHNPHRESGKEGGSEILKKFRDSITRIIAGRTGKEENTIAEMLDKETYMTASECLLEGFCDTITVTTRQNVNNMRSAKTITDKYHTATQIVNKFLQTKKTEQMDTNKMESITNKLGLDADASPDTIARAITQLKNRLATETEKAANAEDALKAANKSRNDLAKELDALKCRIEDEETESCHTAAKDMVNSFAAAGKLDNRPEVLKAWIDLAKVSKDELLRIKNMLALLPVNKEANKIEVVNTLNGGGKNLSMKMHELAKKHGQK